MLGLAEQSCGLLVIFSAVVLGRAPVLNNRPCGIFLRQGLVLKRIALILVGMAVIGWKPPLAHAQTPDPSVEQRLNDVQGEREAAEKFIVDQECATLNADRAIALSRIGLQIDEGLACAAKLIDALSIDKIAGDPGLLVAPNALWRLVDRAVVRRERRPAIRALLERLRSQLDHPMRAHAWLGLRMLDREDGTLVLQGSPLPYVAVPTAHLDALLPPTPAALPEILETAHPLQREALIWLMAQVARRNVDIAPPIVERRPELSRIARLSQQIAGYGSTRVDLLAAFIDGLFADDYMLLVPPGSGSTPTGSDVLPEMEFTLTGSICSDGDRCQSVENVTTAVTNLSHVVTTSLNDTLSYAQIFIPFVDSSVPPYRLRAYRGHVATFVRGGRWTKRSLIGNILLDGGDGASSVSYTLEGEV